MSCSLGTSRDATVATSVRNKELSETAAPTIPVLKAENKENQSKKQWLDGLTV